MKSYIFPLIALAAAVASAQSGQQARGAAARSPFGGWSRGPSYWQYGNPQFDARNRPNTGRRNRRGQRALDGSELMDWYEDSSDRDC